MWGRKQGVGKAGPLDIPRYAYIRRLNINTHRPLYVFKNELYVYDFQKASALENNLVECAAAAAAACAAAAHAKTRPIQ